MYKDKKTAVIIPAYNEESNIGRVITSLPEWVDTIVVVDDRSKDATVARVKSLQQKLGKKLVLIENERNQGCGGSLARGYKWARDHGVDIAVRMDGDGQMDVTDLPALLDPVAAGEADYAKGNRLITGHAHRKIPPTRFIGNMFLSLLTKIVSGYWHISDYQSGYTAINRQALKTIDWDLMYKRYGQPNDLLVRLNVYDFKVKDVPVSPVYNVGEKSGMKIHVVVLTISWLLIKLFFWRLKEKYIIRDFHPLVFFYFMGLTLLLVSAGLLVRLIICKIQDGFFPPTSSLAWMFSFSMGFQSLFFAMWFDMQSQRK